VSAPGNAGEGDGRRGATVRDVAERAGVSQATAARALGGYGSVSEKARRRVLDAAAALSYQPNDAARALASGAKRAIGLIVADIENPFFAAAARGLSDVVEAHGYTLLLANSDENLDRERAAIEAIRTRVDGFVLSPASDASGAALRAQHSHVVLLDRGIRGLEVDTVTVDNAAGARRAVEHLLALGHHRIGAIADSPEIRSTEQRLRGYRSALRAAGLPAEPELVCIGDSTQQGGYEAATRLLSVRPVPHAVFATNNFMTAGALRAIREQGLRLAQDIALVGFDDTDWATLIEPPLTVVRQPVTEMGRKAGELMMDRLRGTSVPARRVRLRTELVIRQSAGEP
jgi:LacI family transcriptional regulator